MELNNFWLKSNNGENIDLQNLKELKKSDLGNNNALIQLFNIFDTQKSDGTAGSDGVLNKSELTSLFNTFNAGANSSKGMSKSVFESNEAEEYLNTTKTTSGKTLSEIGVKAADVFEFLSKFAQNSNAPVNVNNVANDVHLTEEQAQDEVIATISEDTANARTLLMKQDNGHVSQLYNKAKELFDSDLSLSNVEEAFMLQEECLENLSKAKDGKLSKREYFLQNREHLKTMMKRRLFRKDENTGLDFLDSNRGKMSKQEFAKFMEDYINEEINKIDRLDSLNKIQHSLLTMGTSGVNDVLKKYQKAAQNKQTTNFTLESKSELSKTSAIPEKYNTTEPMTFKEVFEIERNQEYSKDRVEAYISQKQKTDFAVGAYNKYQSFKMNSSEILSDYTKSVAGTYAFGGMATGVQPNPEKQMQKVLEAFESYYANPIDPNSARNEIETLIKDNKLPISVIQDSNGKLLLDLSKLKTDTEKNNVLNKLLKLEDTKLEAKLKTTLGGEVDEMLEMFSTTTKNAFTNAYGHDFTNELVQEMSDDNKTFIQKYTGNASQIGMGLTVVGGVLCFTPLAGVGAAMVGVGNTMAIGGMVAESALGFEEALSRSKLNPEEIKELGKTLVMNAGGFVVGYKAGQTGIKAFNKLIDKKLAEVFKTEMANGNRAEALKQVFSNPEYLKNFMQAAGVKLSADFVISYAGDLAMMGILDTNDDWKSLLQSNLIGIMTSMGGDLKDVANLGIKGNKAKSIQKEEKTNNLTSQKTQELTDLHNNTESKNSPIHEKNEVKEQSEATEKTDVTSQKKENAMIPKVVSSKQNFETKIREINALLNSDNARFISDEVKNTISQNLSKIKDKKLLNEIHNELTVSNFPQSAKLLVLSEFENFKEGGYEVLSPELKRIIQPPRFFTKKNYDMQYEEIKLISDPVKKQKALEEFNLQIESELVLHSAPKIADYLYENYLLKTFPEKYKSIAQEISAATGKKVLPMYAYTSIKNNNYINYQLVHLENYNSLKDYQKDWIKKHADKLLTDSAMYTYKQTQTIKDFTLEKIQLIEDRNIVDIADSEVSGIKALSDTSDENFKRIKDSGLLEYSKFRKDKTTGKELPYKRIKDIVELVEKSSDIELKRIIDRNILDITPKKLTGIDNGLVLALARLDDSTWNYIKNDLGLIKDNVLDIFHEEGAKSLDDVADAMDDMHNMSAGIIKYLDNIQNTRATTETLTAIGVKPEVAAVEAGHLLEGVPSDEIKDYTLDKAYWETNMAKVEDLKNTVLGHPEYYVNGTYPTKADCDNAVNKFFDKHKVKLAELSSAMDKEGVNHLMRKRFEDAEEYLDTLNDFNVKDLDMLKKLCNSVNESGKPFMPTQKVEFIDLISAYKLNNLDMSKMQTMIENGKVNLPELQMDLFNDIMKKSGMSDEEIAKIPPEKLTAWDTKYSHLLAKEADDKAFIDIIKAANLDDFNRYIHDEGNIYGKSNKKTRSEFQQLGMNYEKWLHPSKDSEVKLQIKDKNAEQLSQISNQLLEDINVLRQTPAKGFLNKQFPKCIDNNGDFIIPPEIMQSKSKLNEFINNIIKQLEPVWKRAQGNLNNPDPKRVATAKNTLTILEHLQTRLSDIAKIEIQKDSKEVKVEKDLDLTIKMWDRIPQKDLFQGNYSTCCIGMGGGNGSAMPHYLLNTAYNMIEINDNVTGKTIGNALVYFVKDSSGKPAFIVDNIEINNSAKPSDKGGIAIRSKIAEYAFNVAKEVTGNEDVNIYMGGDYNDVPCLDLPKSSSQVSFLGEIDCDDIYMDLYKGWIGKSDFTHVVELWKLK